MINLLIEGIEKKAVKQTDITKKLVIDNNSESYPVYKIKLDNLYYNDQNDRVATWISQYKAENNIDKIKPFNDESYNSIIHEYITYSNKDALKKTQKNIELIGQQEPGVVLTDGRIIDGNRRFTCLRNIEKATGKTQYFDAVILDYDIKDNEKNIKMLELMLQHGIDEKVDYNPIERLVGVYRDIVDTKLLTVKEYANSINASESEISSEVEKAKLMVEFLEFINAPKKYYLARHFNIVDPLKELHAMLKRINDIDKKEDLKIVVFSQFLVQPFGDTTRYMRKIKKIVNNNKFFEEYISDQMELVEKVCDELEKYPSVSEIEISVIRSDESIKNDFLHSTEKYVNKVDGDLTRNQPIKQTEKAFDNLDLIDLNILKKLTENQLNELKDNLANIEQLILEIKSNLDE